MLSTDLFNHSSGLMEVDTELAWEMSRKAFQQHKLQRTPIKLLVCCACVCLLDLRSNIHVTAACCHGNSN